MKALYRRYRPKTLAEVVGEEQVTESLINSLKKGKIAHAYLFIGPRGCGKTSVARILAHEINEFKYELEDSYLDIIEIDAASNTGVDNIRELREKAIIAPSQGKYKVYIIDEVHMLSKSAFNALLKTLEEPPEHVIFIMATTDAHKIPVTITSRSQVLTFKLANPAVMLEHVKKICTKEKIDIDQAALEIIVRRGGGSFRDTLSLLDQISTITSDKITAEVVTKTLGLPADETVRELLDAYSNGYIETIRNKLAELLDSGAKPEVIAEDLISRITTSPDVRFLPLLEKLIAVSGTHADAKLLLALASNITTPAVASVPTTIISTTKTTTTKQTVTPVVKEEPKKTEITEKPVAEEAPKEEIKTEQTVVEQTTVTTSAPATERIAPSADNVEFWNEFLGLVHEKLASIYAILESANYEIVDTKINVYVKSKFLKRQVDKHKVDLAALIPETYTIEIFEDNKPHDEELADIADIMGGGEEVTINE